MTKFLFMWSQNSPMLSDVAENYFFSLNLQALNVL